MKGYKRLQKPARGSMLKPSAAGRAAAWHSFRARYDLLEHEREALLQRLALHQALLADNPAARRAETLLNSTFRRVPLSRRAAVLQAAAWLIQIIEMSSKIL